MIDDEFGPVKVCTFFVQYAGTTQSLYVETLADRTVEELGVRNVRNDDWLLTEADEQSRYAMLAEFTSEDAADRFVEIMAYLNWRLSKRNAA